MSYQVYGSDMMQGVHTNTQTEMNTFLLTSLSVTQDDDLNEVTEVVTRESESAAVLPCAPCKRPTSVEEGDQRGQHGRRFLGLVGSLQSGSIWHGARSVGQTRQLSCKLVNSPMCFGGQTVNADLWARCTYATVRRSCNLCGRTWFVF
jgi:hypothetical protein